MRDTARIEHYPTGSLPGQLNAFVVLLLEIEDGPRVTLSASYGKRQVQVFRPSAALLSALRKALGPPPKAADWAPCGSERCALGDDCPCYTAGVADNR